MRNGSLFKFTISSDNAGDARELVHGFEYARGGSGCEVWETRRCGVGKEFSNDGRLADDKNSLEDKIVAVDMNTSGGRHFFWMIGITYHRVLSLRAEFMITT